MSSWLARWKRYGTRHRRAGDEARNRLNWQQVAVCYQRHVRSHPRDWQIWTQLGHALKELRTYHLALNAYEHARALRPRDGDLMLNLGHLHKLMGQREIALDWYATGATEGSMDAAAELKLLLAQRPAAAPPPQSLRDQVIKRIVENESDGISVTCSFGITAAPDEKLSIDDGAWIEFEFSPEISAAPMCQLQLQLPSPPLFGQQVGQITVELAYAGQHDGHQLCSLASDTDNTGLLVALPKHVCRLRCDLPAAGGGRVGLALKVEAIYHLEDALFIGRRLCQTSAARAAFEDAAMIIFDLSELSAAQTAALQKQLPPEPDLAHAYTYWNGLYNRPGDSDDRTAERLVRGWTWRPQLSVLLPVYDPDPDLLRRCLSSILAQNYPAFDICIVDDGSKNPAVRRVLAEYQLKYPTICLRFQENNLHISATSNAALAMCGGDFVVLVDHDDELPCFALLLIAQAINENPRAAVFYSDEDKIDGKGFRHSPYFKGKFDRFLMYGHNMVSHIAAYKKDIFDEIGGFRRGLEGSQDYDLALRYLERVGEEGFVHIPHVLYHWRTTAGSTALHPDQKSYALPAAVKALDDHLVAIGSPLRSTPGRIPGTTAVQGDARNDHCLISIIIPTRDRLDQLVPCIDSIMDSDWRNVQIIIVDNGSINQNTHEYITSLSRERSFTVVNYPGAFNFSAINNEAAQLAEGALLCFLNNDTEVVSKGWLRRARALMSFPDIGAVGARLFYPDGRIQHFGLVLGMGEHGVAGAANTTLNRADNGYLGKGALLQQFSAVTAACMFMRRDDFLKAGGFDINLPVAYNDVDLCLRLRDRGLKIVCDPEIELVHRESATRGGDDDAQRRARLDREAAFMHARWGEMLANDPFWSPNHALDRADHALAYPPRRPLPWSQVDDQTYLSTGKA